MSIGEDLGEARRRSGLTLTQVSQRTRIRETIIRAIERGDYAACGGDFYARGHIRAIARAVGADPGPLIAEYDATQRPPQPVTVVDLFQPARPIRIRERHGPNWAMVLALALAVVLGVLAYRVVTSHHLLGPSKGAAVVLHRTGHHHRPAAAPSPTSAAPGPYAHLVAVHMTAIEDCWVEFTTPGGGYLFQDYVVGGTSKSWTFRHAVDMTLGDPGDVRLTVDGRNALPPGTANAITLLLGLNGKISP